MTERAAKKARRAQTRARALRLRRRRRGVALILVLAALTILTAEYAAKSAVNLSRLLIAAEPTIRQSLTLIFALVGGPRQIPVWQYADRILGAFNDASGTDSFAALAGVDPKLGKNLGFPGAGFQLDIVDEDSKININVAARGDAFSQTRLASQLIGLIGSPQYSPMFEGRDADDQYTDRRALCSAIIDWADPDQDQAVCDPTSTTAQQTGAEDSFYQLLKKPYLRKNAAFDSLEELHRVRGVSDDFWSTFVDPDPDKPDKRILTVWGQGKVNVNTANPQTLLALVCQASNNTARMCQDGNEAQKFIMALTMLQSFMPGLPVFASGDEFVNALQQGSTQAAAATAGQPAPAAAAAGGGSPVAMIMKAMGIEPIPILSPKQTKDAVTTESKVFSIYATGYVHSGKRESSVHIHAVVDFRGAPTPADIAKQLMQQLNPNAANGAAPPAVNGIQNGVPTPPANGTAAAGTQTGIQGSLKPGSGGNIVYYRVD